MSPFRLLIGFLGVVLTGLIVWAAGASDFWAALTWLTTDPWGIVTLTDLYTGFVFASIVIAFVERSWTAALWIVPVYFLGNVVTALWLVLRWQRVAALTASR